MQEHRTMQDTVNAIYYAVCAAPDGLTRLEIARAINRKKTPHLMGVIDRLADEGWLVRETKIALNGREAILYKIGRKC